MTSETPEERSDEGVSDSRAGSDATREQRSDEGVSDSRAGSEATREQEVSNGDDSDADDDIPLTIAGHEDRERPGDEGSDDEATAEAETDAEDAPAGGPMNEVLPDDVRRDDDGDSVEPVELLVQLAEDGRIDPWDIDVVRVTEEFLDALDEGDLRASGRALFYASVLVRMKGDDLLTDDEPEDEPEPWEAALEGGEAPPPDEDPVTTLEAEMERRLDRKHARGTPETLDELVRELREAERDTWWKEGRTYDTSDSPSGYDRGTQTLDYRANDDLRTDGEPTAGEVTSNTHTEDIEATIDDVRGRLRTHYDNGRTEVLYEEVADAGGSRVQTFLALLFLAHRGTVRLQQDDLFGDLWVQDPAAAADSGEVTAD